MLERTTSLLSFIAAISIGGACTSDRAAMDQVPVGTLDGGLPSEVGSDAPVCAFGQILCEGNLGKVCDGQGGFMQVFTCSSECKDGPGCVDCVPNTGVCNSNQAVVCDSTGARTVTFACDGEGMTCAPDGCKGPCSPTVLGSTHVGCDFWPTVTANSVWSGFSFGVLLGNTSATEVATVKITGIPGKTVVLQPLEVQAVHLAWDPKLKGGDWQTPYQPPSSATSVKSSDGAYHIVSNQPLVAYQFSPLEGTVDPSASCPTLPGPPAGCYSYSTDASLLFPAHTLSSNYLVTGYHGLHENPFPSAMGTTKLDMGDFIAITATQSKTGIQTTTNVNLKLRPKQAVLGWDDVHPLPGDPITLSMVPGQVLQLFTPGTSLADTLSGTEITADGKIEVLSGVGCASIPLDPAHCGHLEDSVLPTEALGKDYIVPVLQLPSRMKVPHTIRIQSISDDTPITFEPPIMTGVTLSHGETVEIPNVMVDLHISSPVPFAVTQFVSGRSKAVPDGFTVGGPNQVSLVASSQFKTVTYFAASPNYEYNFASVVGPTGASVMLDGQPVGADLFVAVGASGMSVARVPLAQNDRVHVLQSDKPVGAVVYGYARYASYAYPAGLDLRRAPVPGANAHDAGGPSSRDASSSSARP